MSTLVELQAELQKILDEEFPSVAKYVWLEPGQSWLGLAVVSRGGCDTYGYYCWPINSVDHLRELARFRESMSKFSRTLDDLINNGEQVCDECSHYLDKYKYVAAMIPFRDFSGMKLPTRMKCVHVITNPCWKYIDNVHRREHLCRELRILPLPIADEIMMYVE